MNMGDRIRICLKQQNMTMKDLAIQAEIPLSTLSDLLNGKTKKLDVQKAKEISNILGCTLDYLIDADLMDDIGYALQSERESKGYSLEELSAETKIPIENLKEFEDSIQPINFFLLQKICDAYDISVNQFYVDTEIYDEYIPEHFNGNVDSYEAFKAAKEQDALDEARILAKIKKIVKKIKELPVDKQDKIETLIDELASGVTIAAHRTDDSMKDLPPEAQASIRAFISEIRKIYSKE